MLEYGQNADRDKQHLHKITEHKLFNISSKPKQAISTENGDACIFLHPLTSLRNGCELETSAPIDCKLSTTNDMFMLHKFLGQ